MTIRCEQVPEALADVLGGEATPERQRELEGHVSVCPTCAHEQQGLGEMLVRARSALVPEPPAEYWLGFGAELHRRIAQARACERASLRSVLATGWLAWLRPLGAAAALAALTFVLLGRPAGSPSPSPDATASIQASGVEPDGAGPGMPSEGPLEARPGVGPGMPSEGPLEARPGVGPGMPSEGPPEARPGVDPARAAALAAAFDLIEAEGTLGAPADPLDEMSVGTADAFVSSAPSGDVFAFLDTAQPLTAEETDAVLAALENSFAG